VSVGHDLDWNGRCSVVGMLRVVLGLALLTLAACSDASPTYLRNAAPCPADDARFSALPLREGVSGLAIFQVEAKSFRLTPAGEPCANASDPAGCRAKVEALAANAVAPFAPPRATGTTASEASAPPPLVKLGGPFTYSGTYLVVATAGDNVEAQKTFDDVLGRVTTTDQALAVYRLSHFSVACSALTTEPSEHGFLFRSDGGCPRTETIDEVHADRSITRVASRALEEAPHGGCPIY